MKRWSERTGLSGGSSLAAHEYALHRATIWVPRRARRRVYTRLRLKISYKSVYFEEIADGPLNVSVRHRLATSLLPWRTKKVHPRSNRSIKVRFSGAMRSRGIRYSLYANPRIAAHRHNAPFYGASAPYCSQSLFNSLQSGV